MGNTSLLLVEGKNDSNVIKALCQQCAISVDFETKVGNSISELKIGLKTYIKSTQEYRKIWVIIDADNNFEGAWQSIKDILIRSEKYDVEHLRNLAMPIDGIIIAPDDSNDITIGVWIMPNNTDVGMLEDFLIGMIPQDDALLLKSKDVVEDIETTYRAIRPNLFKTVHKSKAMIHTWLSWHHEPGASLSVAVNKKLFETDADLCHKFRNWLTMLND